MPSALQELLTELRTLNRVAAASLDGDLDADQIELYDLAFNEAELRAADAVRSDLGAEDATRRGCAELFCAQAAIAVHDRLRRHAARFDLAPEKMPGTACATALDTSARLRALGLSLLEHGLPGIALPDEHKLIQDTFGAFSDEVVKPLAEAIHREDRMIPDAILDPLKGMGCFGLSVPQRYGGLKPDNEEDSLGMVIVTEELSRGSLGGAGSLITRPEIMARAIMEGGTEEQRQRWLPGLAAGTPLCAISVTEPNTGSDVANVRLRAKRVAGGWLLNGAKTWCTFAGKAEWILVLARTDPDIRPPHKGLSLFVVEKPSTDGHDFEHVQAQGGRISGRAIATIGYRGMHSYEVFYDDYFVPAENLIGEAAGEGRGFYFTMRGFMGGRLQTAARACGVMRAAYDSAAAYASQREVFDKPVALYPLTLAKFARMGAAIYACRAFTQAVAGLMDAGQGAMEASLVKLLACREAEWVTREAVQVYGGMGYAEETDVSRLFVDARVLSIFEGAEETLAVRVIGKGLCDAARGI